MKATLHLIRLEEGCLLRGRIHVELPTKDRLKYMQKVVDGLIDIYHHQGRDWVVNDEGLLLDLPLNPWALEQGLQIAGNIIEVHGVLE